ncbi:hypothetical protein UFOVP1666_129 [uncultured Caudovirales phage]|uniref:Uncharacterized protein n=1 Tax=uncultured Caudovirales phage TaxID=2100421 RepID=A0A6J5Q0X0_9CAUD|nr:hypothetical protein UFOVP867_84 [uncultured Caudovirales phage]CAB4170805.1 hypothetical protein UFOVP913_114 [uncultured Caudovirales phage]CAB4177092.1 hypothetical protein UFOVP993_167 [uncultured Caudovirales phage]CAB4223094.1 hypothetical protein UFOVP1666_129 [uncultured Caudovirales phage]
MDATMLITLSLDVNEVNTILRSLGKHPFDEIASIIAKVKKQGEEQIAAAQATEAEVPTA